VYVFCIHPNQEKEKYDGEAVSNIKINVLHEMEQGNDI